MFTPNLTGLIERKQDRDIYGRSVLSSPVACAFAVVNARHKAQKTPIDSISSGSRGSAEETLSNLAKILIPGEEQVSIGDIFSFGGARYEIAGVHARYAVSGRLDHFECDLEILPEQFV